MKKAYFRLAAVLPLIFLLSVSSTEAGNSGETAPKTVNKETAPGTGPRPEQEMPGVEKKGSGDEGAGYLEEFLIEYPDWEWVESDNPDAVVTLRKGPCRFQLLRVAIPLVFYTESVKNYIEENGGRIVQEERKPEYSIAYEMYKEGHVIFANAKAVRCEDHTYMAFFYCLERSYDERMETKLFESMECKRNWSAAARDNRKLGLVLNPSDLSSIESYNEAYNMARDNHAQVSHHYVQWGDVEPRKGDYEWQSEDFTHELIGDKGLEASTVISIIHTSVKGKMPADVGSSGWDDPELSSRFVDFILKYIERYQDTLRYVEIGNEVNIYFLSHPEEVEPYSIFYARVIDAVRDKFPGILTGTVFAYHTLKKYKQQPLYQSLLYGDFDAFTLYIYEDGFEFSHEPDVMFDWLKEIEQLTGKRKFALVEAGWSSALSLGADEEEQAEAVNAFFDYLEQAPERLEYASWFLLHDWSREEGQKQAVTFFEDPDEASIKSPAMDDFITFLIYLGLTNKNGMPKEGWHTWVKRAEDYQNKP